MRFRLTEKSLTDRRAVSEKMPAGKTDHIVWDDVVPRFGARLRESGKRTLIFKYKLCVKGRKPLERTVTLGDVGAMSVSDARKLAADYQEDVRKGNDPAAAKTKAKLQATDKRLGERIDEYLAIRLPRMKPRSYEEIKRHLQKHAKPLHDCSLLALDDDAGPVKVLFKDITRNSGETAANRVTDSLSAFFNWATKEEPPLMRTNPASLVTQHDEKTRKRKRVLSDNELRLIWQCLPPDGDDYTAIVKLLLLSGQRRDEIASLRWSEMPKDYSWIELPGERVKNGEEHKVPLPEEARAIIAKREHWAGRDLLFGRGSGGYSGWSTSKARLDAAIAEKAGKPLKPWVLHDLRRTFATKWAGKPMSVHPWVVEAQLNHVSGHKSGIASVYNLETYDEERAAAMARWNDLLMSIVQ